MLVACGGVVVAAILASHSLHSCFACKHTLAFLFVIMDICIICKGQLSVLDKVATLTQKGCDGTLKASKARQSLIDAVPGKMSSAEVNITT